MDVGGLGIACVHPKRDEREALGPRRDRAIGSVVVFELDRQRLQHLAAIPNRARACDKKLEHGHTMEMCFDRLVRLQFRHRRLWPWGIFRRRSRTKENSSPMLDSSARRNHLISLGERIDPTTCIDHDHFSMCCCHPITNRYRNSYRLTELVKSALGIPLILGG